MSIDRLGTELEALGVTGRDARCLLLLPQVYVGWASQRRDVPALEALLDATAGRAGLEPGCLALARGWLFERPSRAQFQSGFALLRMLRRAPVEPLIVTSDLLEALVWASHAARLDREPTVKGKRGPVTLAARRALNELEAWLEVETGDLWSELLSDEDAPNAYEALSEKFEALSDGELESAMAMLERGTDEEHSAVLRRHEERGAPASVPFPLVRRHA
jgi:hypothetical protein